MDINTLRSLATLACFGLFLGVLWWACRPANATRFDEAAMLPFTFDEPPAADAQVADAGARTGEQS